MLGMIHSALVCFRHIFHDLLLMAFSVKPSLGTFLSSLHSRGCSIKTLGDPRKGPCRGWAGAATSSITQCIPPCLCGHRHNRRHCSLCRAQAQNTSASFHTGLLHPLPYPLRDISPCPPHLLANYQILLLKTAAQPSVQGYNGQFSFLHL